MFVCSYHLLQRLKSLPHPLLLKKILIHSKVIETIVPGNDLVTYKFTLKSIYGSFAGASTKLPFSQLIKAFTRMSNENCLLSDIFASNC